MSLTWPPTPPDISRETLLSLISGCLPGSALISVFKDGKRLSKTRLTAHEYKCHRAAGSCAVEIVGRVLINHDAPHQATKARAKRQQSRLPRIEIYGIIMLCEKPLDYQSPWDPIERREVISKLIHLIKELHKDHQIVHGDIKPPNILRCHDSSIRLCDFDEARLISDDPQEWEGEMTVKTSSPRRIKQPHLAPTIDDDLYSLGVTIWMLYANQIPLEPVEFQQDGSYAAVTPIEIGLITDLDVRDQVEGLLALSGMHV